MKKILALTVAALLCAAPVFAQTRTERNFIDFAYGFTERYEPIQASLDNNDWEEAATHLEEMTLWLIAEDPHPCYAGLWGIAIAFTAASTQLAIAQSYSSADVLLVLEMNDFLTEIKAVQDVVTSGPPLPC